MQAHEFKVGDKVRIVRKVKDYIWCSPEMDQFIGKFGKCVGHLNNPEIEVLTNLGNPLTFYFPKKSLQLVLQKTRQELISIIESKPKNCIITVEFVKKDGSLRKLTGIRGPTKYLKGSPGENKPTIDTDKHFLFCEMRKGYRAVAKDRLMSVSVSGIYYFTEETIG